MCRFFATISTSTIDAGYLLQTASQSLLYESRVRRKELQKDGWGVGWFERGRPQIYKSPNPIYKDFASPHPSPLGRGRSEAAGEAQTTIAGIRRRCLVGHVRWASNPLKLPKNHLIGRVHSQPFSFGSWLFAHNGTLLIPKEVREALGPLGQYIKGNNDSEVLFYWLMKHLLPSSPRRKPGSRRLDWVPASAGMTALVSRIRKSISELDTIWQSCRNKYPLYKYPYHGLNWVLTNGKILIAMCYVNPGGFGKAKALIRRQEPYYQLRYKHDASGWMVASEPLDHDPLWKCMRHGQILVVNGGQGRFLWL